MKGSKYYKFDPEKKPPVPRSYPKSVSNWEGIPNNIDDALKYSNGYTYFFKGGKYWRFDDSRFTVCHGRNRSKNYYYVRRMFQSR